MKETSDTATRRPQDARGFSLLELLVAMALGATLLGVTIMATRSGLTGMRANSSVDVLKVKMHVARELAMTRQREITLTFTSNRVLEFRQVNPGEATQPLVETVALEGDMEFYKFASGAPAPVAWCTEDSSNLNGKTGLRFNTEGVLVDAARNQVNGCLWLANSKNQSTGRVIRAFGSTGRLAVFHWQGTVWSH
jgi:prepilin-type N-terminal cleavage/methylation domain-containing protein